MSRGRKYNKKKRKREEPSISDEQILRNMYASCKCGFKERGNLRERGCTCTWIPVPGERLTNPRITKGRAKSEYGLKDRDMEGLNVEYARNPLFRWGAAMQLYLIDEVKEKSKLVKAAAAESLKAKTESAVAARMAKLQKASIDASVVKEQAMFKFIFEDFLDKSVAKPMHGINVVKKRFKAYVLLKRMPPTMHARTDLCTVLQGVKILKRDNPFSKISNVVLRSIRASRLLASVLFLGPVQVHLSEYLLPDDISGFKEAVQEYGNISDALQQASAHIEKQTAKKIGAFEKYLDNADFSIERKSRDEAIQRMKEHPYHPVFGVAGMMAQVERMSGESSEERRDRLVAKWNQIIPNEDEHIPPDLSIDSKLCGSFINKTTLASCEEVVAMKHVSNWLFSYCVQAWSELSRPFERQMLKLVIQKRVSWLEAAFKVSSNGMNKRQCERVQRQSERYPDYGMSSDDDSDTRSYSSLYYR